MPLVRAEVRNEYGLGQPELYKEVNREDPKAVLDGVAVAGLVGILRQLGDLAEFAAEVFHGLQEQVMSTASRSHKLMVRVQRIEAALPPLEKAVLAQTSHIHFAYTAGSEWHPRIRNENNHFIYNDLPRFIMDSYEVCRDPPRLHLLDKFDAGGPGACLKRYSDPTYFKRASGSSIAQDAEKVPRERKSRKSKKRRSSHRNGELSRGASLSNCSGRMQFPYQIVKGRTSSSQTASTFDMALKSDRGEHSNSSGSRTGSGYIECDFNLGSPMPPEEQERREVSSRLMQEPDTLSSDFQYEQTQVVNDHFSRSSSQEQIAPNSSCVTWDEKAEIVESKAGGLDRDEVPEMNFDVHVQETGASNLGNGDQMDAPESSFIQNQDDDIESEPDNYMDALNTIESESENDIECHTKREVEQHYENDVECQMKQEVGQNDDANNVNRENEDGMDEVMDHNLDHHPSITECSASSNIISNNAMSASLLNPVPSEKLTSEQMPQISGKSSDLDNSPSIDSCMSDEIHNGSLVESVITDPSSSSGSTVSDIQDTASDRILNSVSDSQNSSQTGFTGVHSVGFWTNGSLLGLQPSKPPDFAASATTQSSGAQSTEAFGAPNQTPMPVCDGPKVNYGTVVENAASTEKDAGSHSEKTFVPVVDLGANLEKPATSVRNNSLEGINGAGLNLNTSLPHGNKHSVSPNVQATSVESDEENDDKSSKMFGLGHKLLVNGFRRQVSISHDGEAEPAASTKSGLSDERNGHQSISNHKIPWSSFSERIGNGSPVNSLTSSPPLEHMKISFNPIDGFETSKLRLQFPDGNHHKESMRDMFPSFQLVPGPSLPIHDVALDSDDDTFCRSSPYMSDDCLSQCSESNSEQWESSETPESKDPELYDALSRLSSMESVSSSLQAGEAANGGIHVNGGHKAIVHGTSTEPSLPVSLDLPSFDAINPLLQGAKSNSDQKNQPELENSAELTPVPPPPPPAQWRVSKPSLIEAEQRQHALSESLRHELDLKLLGSTVSHKPKPLSANQQQINDEAIALKPEKHADKEQLNRQKEANQLHSGRGMDEKEDFLYQIRTKSFNLRPTVPAKATVTSGPTTNVKVTAILQKANAIRQAVGSDDGEDDDDTWSDA